MLEDNDFKEFALEFYSVMEFQDEALAELDRKLEHIGEVIKRTEWKIKHFGEAWPEDV